MITVYIGGGLANKMFQYALSLSIRQRGYAVNYDTHTFQTEFEHDRVTLQSIFKNIDMQEAVCDYMAAGCNDKLSRFYKRLSSRYVIENAYQYNDKLWKQIREDCYIEGSWQDERYFKEVETEVRSAYRFTPFSDKRNLQVANEMKDSSSIAVHIRKGDGYGSWNIFSHTCPKSYYDKAVYYIRQHVGNPKFFVFTDSPGIVKEYLDLDDYRLINWNPTTGMGNHYDMQLMSCAKHNIIANSTYSWWGAWLNANPEKIVVGPKYWFSPQSKLKDINHMIPNNWIKI